MTWSMVDTWIVVGAILSAVACALPGNFLVLRRMSMMGDAISHAVLPGLAAAFIITGSRSGLPMFLGAAVVGMLTALFTQWINHFGKVEESASMGVVFTTLFAVGLIGIVRAADHVDLDPGCVLYGAIELVPLDTISLFGTWIPRVVVIVGAVLVVNVVFLVAFYKELKISAFDPDLATTVGVNSRVMHYALMTIVAVTTVACFESVGSILVIAMLIVPAATAYLLTDRLGMMIAISVVVAVACAIGGHVAAVIGPGLIGYDGMSTNTSGMMAVVAGVIFLAALLAAPRHGVVSKMLHQWSLSMSILREDVLGLIYRLEEHESRPTAIAPIVLHEAMGVGLWSRSMAFWGLSRRGLVTRQQGEYHITTAGRDKARDLVRSHRLWESYLQRHLDLRDDHVHPTAARLEHVTSATMQRELERRAPPPATRTVAKSRQTAGGPTEGAWPDRRV
ncbi:MAG: metal ABC transporter permease [Verrucomicrobia bacterium]|nr:metal ABC transporter permease [Verrucomicrobiota bacterium]